MKPKPLRSQGLQALYDRYVGNDPKRLASYETALANAEIATHVYDLRTQASLSRRELAARVGTIESVICRLEDADYAGHSMAMLRRVAAAVGQRVVISFVPVK